MVWLGGWLSVRSSLLGPENGYLWALVGMGAVQWWPLDWPLKGGRNG